MNNILQLLHLSPNQIIETIISTYNADRSPNAAPMGIIFTQRGVLIKPFLKTSTCRNLAREQCCTINFTTDPEIFLRTAFKKRGRKLPEKWFIKAEKIDAPILKEADAIIEAKVKRIHQGEQRARIECEILKTNIFKSPPFGYCRAKFALIESIIHGTRILENQAEGKNREAEKLRSLIELYRGLVERVAPKSTYTKLIAELIRKINIYR